MSSINFAAKEISVKIVFYGPGLCGKTTTLQHIYSTIAPERRPKMVSLATDVDRTIFFDFLPVSAYKVRDFLVRLQLYTVPGQVFYNSTRKLVLNGADGVVFVVDSQKATLDSNIESFRNLEENLQEQGVPLASLPHVIQYNKRDLEDLLSEDELGQEINKFAVPAFSTVATTGVGVMETLKEISRQVIQDVNKKGLGRRLTSATEGSSTEDNPDPGTQLPLDGPPKSDPGSFSTAFMAAQEETPPAPPEAQTDSLTAEQGAVTPIPPPVPIQAPMPAPSEAQSIPQPGPLPPTPGIAEPLPQSQPSEATGLPQPTDTAPTAPAGPTAAERIASITPPPSSPAPTPVAAVPEVHPQPADIQTPADILEPAATPASANPNTPELSILAPVWDSPGLGELANQAEDALRRGDSNSARAHIESLLEAALRTNLPPECQGWDRAQCALYKGLPGHLFSRLNSTLATEQCDERQLRLAYLISAIAIHGWGEL